MDAETTVQGLLQKAYDNLKASEAPAAALALEEALRVDFEHPEVVYALKCVNWWLERSKRLGEIRDGYERGEFARIPLRYDAAKGTLTIGARSGSFPGMSQGRTFKVRWIKAGGKAPADLDAAADSSVEYSGVEVTVTM